MDCNSCIQSICDAGPPRKPYCSTALPKSSLAPPPWCSFGFPFRAIPMGFALLVGCCGPSQTLAMPVDGGPRSELSHSLKCSACIHSAHAVRQLLIQKVKRKMNVSAKREAAKGVITKACDHIPQQIAKAGEPAEYHELELLMRKGKEGPHVKGLSMQPSDREDLVGICRRLMNKFGARVSDRVASFKGRVWKENWEHVICVEVASMCKSTPKLQLHQIYDPNYALWPDKDDEL
eukprot:TRINITY_DN62837_c0_g1_i1.p1 TRINITY_DN62837_c0_g1~~TRINITY_DN62837_c0_g1_i1.p1  ORF type:complete len:234 (+),score=39.16 TRINITY_DN62837_c0_g1_i1:59-760(+)